MLGIVGSRNFKDYISFKAATLKVLKEWNWELENVEGIVSGGALGTDKWRNNLPMNLELKNIFFQ